MASGDTEPQPAVAQATESSSVDAPRPPGPEIVVAETPAVANAGIAVEAGEEVEACGGGWVRVDGDEKQLAATIGAAVEARQAAVSRVTLAVMRASADERVRAAALYYQARLSQAQTQTADAHRDELVRLAQSSTDPVVYGWAVGACSNARGSPTCRLVSAAQWARLDPDNAVAWLALADEARDRGDSPAVDDALFHVASATRYDHAEATLSSAILDHAPADEASLLGVAAMASSGHAFVAADTGRISTPSLYCGARDLADANRRETCERIATLAAERSTSLRGRDAGHAIGKDLGWPGERLKAMEAQRLAQEARLVARSRESKDMLSCEWAQAEVQHIRNLADRGEIEPLR